jgi:hypothetical protein
MTLKDVKEDQLFINYQRFLCQKSYVASYHSILNDKGELFACHYDIVDPEEEIIEIIDPMSIKELVDHINFIRKDIKEIREEVERIKNDLL